MSESRQTLEFEDDPGAKRSTWIAAGIVVAVVLWMGSGFFFPPAPEEPEAASAEEGPQPVSVSTRISTAEPVTLYFQAEAQALPDRDTPIRAEVSGDVAEVLVKKGEDVTAGQVLALFTTRRLEADLRRAGEELDRAQREFDNAQELLERGVATQDRLTDARAALAAARSQRTAAEEALESARIEAPFDGRIERLSLDDGEYVTAGAEVGRIVDNRPLTVSFQVPQRALNRLRGADTAHVTFITGEERTGTLAFVGTSASAETRTFLAEVVVPNEDGSIPAGISAEVRIPTGEAEAHFIAPSVVSMNEEGAIGVKTVEDGQVFFREIEIVRAEVNGVWAAGLPETIELITIGQGYVRDGEPVVTRSEPDENGRQAAGE